MNPMVNVAVSAMKLGLTPPCNVNVTLAALRLMPPVPSAPSAVATTVPC